MTVARSEPTSTTSGNGTRPSSVRAVVRSRLGIDPRALGAFRIGLGLVVLFDLLVLRAPGLGTFYTDGGILPRSALGELYPALARWSLHAQSGSFWIEAFLLAGTCLLATCVLAGYRSRLAAVGTALLLASLHARNPFLVNGGDTILISLLIIAAFLPLEARWSLRRRLDGRCVGTRSVENRRITSIATATVLVHVVSIYAINAILKFRSDAWMSGVAVPRIFQLEDFIYLLGPVLAEHTAVLTAINWLWIVTLSTSVLLVLSSGWIRSVTVSAFVVAHLGMAATMRLGAFPFVMVAVLLLFFPPRVWDRLAHLVSRFDRGRRLESLATERRSGDKSESSSSEIAVPPRIRRGARLVGVAFLVGFVLISGCWQVVAAGLVDAPAAVADSDLDGASWAFFAPNPPDSYSWYVIEAERESGASMDLVDGEAADFDRPPDAMDRYPTTLWKRYGTKTQGAGAAHLEPAAVYFCGRAPADVESITIYRADQPVDADGPVGEPIRRELIAASCE
ncbi:HTTM domain-containing protein [Natrinema halophilum]|uniref:HTTM domain-containing protein n=1 Tax=Natrinema halophilum TaxID=1699371 RepID=A0A7D5KI92_9EURY|nr:HTTM domain-containing protein [Natrinema halophilum]QLG48279.1 HTTM domain-containing protein [Natrinema halophilum]